MRPIDRELMREVENGNLASRPAPGYVEACMQLLAGRNVAETESDLAERNGFSSDVPLRDRR